MFKKVILFFAIQFAFANSAKILGIVPTPSYSHQIPFQPIWRELSLRGHQVTTITPNPINDPTLTNLTEIDLNFVYEFWNKENLNFATGKYNNLIDATRLFVAILTKMVDLQLGHEKVKELINNENEHFDLVIVEYFIPIMYAFGERFKCPVIGITTVDVPNYILKHFGNPTHPILNQDILLPYFGKMTFFQRIESVLMDIFYPMLWKQCIPSMQKVVNKHFGDGFTSIPEMIDKMSLLFSNGNWALSPIKPLVPAIIQIGGGIHFHPPKPLPSDLQKYLDDAKEGVIYFSLGSNVKSKDLPQETKEMLLETFSELPYKVLWKFEDDSLSKKPKNVLISKWLPQQDILKHPNIKVFISQGGYHSVEEALYSKVPVLGMPFLGDQMYNTNNVVHKGFGLRIDDSTNMKKDELKTKLLELINNPKYRNRVEELAKIGLDEPMTGLERAIWWIEYVIRHKGAKHLRSPALDLPTYQYYLLDVIGFCVAVVSLALYLIVKIVKLFVKGFKYLFLKKAKSD